MLGRGSAPHNDNDNNAHDFLGDYRHAGPENKFAITKVSQPRCSTNLWQGETQPTIAWRKQQTVDGNQRPEQKQKVTLLSTGFDDRTSNIPAKPTFWKKKKKFWRFWCSRQKDGKLNLLSTSQTNGNFWNWRRRTSNTTWILDTKSNY